MRLPSQEDVPPCEEEPAEVARVAQGREEARQGIPGEIGWMVDTKLLMFYEFSLICLQSTVGLKDPYFSYQVLNCSKDVFITESFCI